MLLLSVCCCAVRVARYLLAQPRSQRSLQLDYFITDEDGEPAGLQSKFGFMLGLPGYVNDPQWLAHRGIPNAILEADPNRGLQDCIVLRSTHRDHAMGAGASVASESQQLKHLHHTWPWPVRWSCVLNSRLSRVGGGFRAFSAKPQSS